MRVCPNCFAQEKSDANFCGLCGTQLVEIKSTEKSYIGLLLNDKYVIKRLIGRGGMGEVYLAEHQKLGQQVAVKFLNQRFTSDSTVVVRFINEAKSYCLVTHPNAVTLHDFGQLEDGTLFIIMEFIDGLNLSEFMVKHGPQPPKRCLNLAHKLAEVLLAAHNQGVIHRDLKPDNIMILEPSPDRFQLKVLDFGIAKILDSEDNSEQLTQAGMVFGTPEFMSPEQAQGQDVDARTDIYAFGMLLYYMLTAHLPFEGDNKLAVLNSQVHDEPPPPSAAFPHLDIPRDIEALLLTCVEKDRDDRYPAFEDVLKDLDRILHGQPPKLVEGSLFLSLDTQPATPQPSPAPPPVAEPSLLLTQPKPKPVDPLEKAFDAAPISDIIDIADIRDDEPDPLQSGLIIIPEDDAPLILADPKRTHEGFHWGDGDEDDDDTDDDVIDDDYDPRALRRSSGSTGLIAFLALLIGGGIAAWILLSGEESPSEPAPGATPPETTTAPVTASDAQSPPDAVTAQTDTTGSPAPLNASPAPQAITARLATPAVAKVLLDQAQKHFDDLDFEKVSPLGRFVRKRLSGLPKATLEKARDLEEKAKKAKDFTASGERYARKLRCDRAESIAKDLREVSPKAADALDDKVKRCQRDFASAPDDVD